MEITEVVRIASPRGRCEAGEQAGNERRARDECRSDHVFVQGVSAVTDCAKTVECRNPERRREISVRPATGAALARVGLDGFAARPAGTLAYGHQRLLEIAMGLALRPRLLILDEPTQGLAQAEIAAFKTLARDIAASATLLLIEHNMDVVMDLADRITVLNFGETLATGTPAAIRADPAVQAAYLGP